MADGQVIKDEDRVCPDCGKPFKKIVEHDSTAAVVECSCGKRWTIFYETKR